MVSMEEKKDCHHDDSALRSWFESFVDAIDHGKDDAIHACLTQGKEYGFLQANVQWGDDYYTPLHYIAQQGCLSLVQEMVEDHHIPSDIKTGHLGRSPLHLAALKGHIEVVQYLAGRGFHDQIMRGVHNTAISS